jgi:cell division protein ZapE
VPGLLARYDALIASGELRADADQRAAAVKLAALQTELETPPAASGLIGKLFGSKPAPPPRGLYIWRRRLGGRGRQRSVFR